MYSSTKIMKIIHFTFHRPACTQKPPNTAAYTTNRIKIKDILLPNAKNKRARLIRARLVGPSPRNAGLYVYLPATSGTARMP